MSRKQIYGITLTEEEKRMAGYGITSGMRQMTPTVPAPAPGIGRAGVAAGANRRAEDDATALRSLAPDPHPRQGAALAAQHITAVCGPVCGLPALSGRGADPPRRRLRHTSLPNKPSEAAP